MTILTKHTFQALAVGTAVAGLLALATPALADEDQSAGPQGEPPAAHRSGLPIPFSHRPSLVGIVTAINGTTLTVSGRAPGIGGATSTMSYSVDASSATIVKEGRRSSVADIVVGDRIMVQGAVHGTSVTATAIRDAKRPGEGGPGPLGRKGAPALGFTGNGQPIIGGTVSAVNGSTVTVATKGGATYTVDVASASVLLRGATSTVSAIGIGSHVIVQGSVNGTSVTASTVIVGGTESAEQNVQGENESPRPPAFLRAVGNFFSHIFGFF